MYGCMYVRPSVCLYVCLYLWPAYTNSYSCTSIALLFCRRHHHRHSHCCCSCCCRFNSCRYSTKGICFQSVSFGCSRRLWSWMEMVDCLPFGWCCCFCCGVSLFSWPGICTPFNVICCKWPLFSGWKEKKMKKQKLVGGEMKKQQLKIPLQNTHTYELKLKEKMNWTPPAETTRISATSDGKHVWSFRRRVTQNWRFPCRGCWGKCSLKYWNIFYSK